VPDYTVLVTDDQLNVVGDPIFCWSTLDVTLRFNEPSSGILTTPGFSWIREQMSPGYRVVVIRNHKILIAGPIEKWMYERSDDGDNAGDGNLTVNFADDLAFISARLTYPNPALTPSTQVIDNWTWTGNAELGLRALADGNAGPSALAARQVPQLVLGPVAGVGTSITSSADRMEPVGDVMRRMAISGGGLGFRTQQVGQTIEFQVFQPTDLSDQVFFSFGLGNLKYASYEVSAPTATTAIVGGQGDGADRFLLERTNIGGETAWGRMEKLVSRPGNDPTADLQQAGDDELNDDKETARLATTTGDTPWLSYGVDYDLGSLVTVESWPGALLSDVVTTVHIQAWPTAGDVISATIGDQSESTDPAWIQRLRVIDRRVGYLERNVLPATT
jgi:hypothetical protein